MKDALKTGPAPRDRSCGARDAFLPAPGELEQQEIIVRAFLFDAVEHFTKLAVCQKKAQPLAFIAVAIVVQDLFDVHGNLLVDGIEHIRVCNNQYRRAGLLAIEAPCSKLQGIFDPQGSTIYSNRSLAPQQTTGNALAPGFTFVDRLICPVVVFAAASRC